MTRALVTLVGLAACHAELEPPWQLDHDRIVAVRATPPGIAAGETALIDGLVAHAGQPTDVEAPTGATAPTAPGGLYTIVHFVFDHWEIQGPDDTALAPARAELGLGPTDPVPLDVTLVFHDLVATKRVWLGESLANPAPPEILIDGAAPITTIVVARDSDVKVEADATDVRWFTSVGALDAADQPVATLHAGDPAQGEFAVVVRDGTGGMSWQVWPLESR